MTRYAAEQPEPPEGVSPPSADPVRRDDRREAGPTPTDAAPTAAPKAAGKQRRPGNRRLDHEKVARLKSIIAAGEYHVDPKSVAQRFIEHERNR